jgi:hypothetical protein
MAKRPTSTASELEDDDNGNEGGRSLSRKLDPLVRALLGHLPPAHAVWPPADRAKWLQLLSEAFGVIYKDAPDPPKTSPASGSQHPPGTVPPPR